VARPDAAHRTISVLGSTGSVGQATLDVACHEEGRFSVRSLTANRNVDLLAQQAIRARAEQAVIADDTLYGALKERLAGSGVKAAAGRQAVIDAAGDKADITMAAIMGVAGLEPILAAIAGGKKVAIANKEPLVSAGSLVMEAARQSGAALLPVDSEHNAIFQVFEKANADKISRIILTASGGPFREWALERMERASPEEALAHPNWKMGQKISIDSATMFNKALEVIEAHHLFTMPPEKIDVLLHPQSIIHSMVEYEDGSVLAQMGAPDMRVPISHVLASPGRMKSPAQRLDFSALSPLSFGEVDECRFPAIKLAYESMNAGQGACVAMNAANEVAVAAFLGGRMGFMDIFRTVRAIVEAAPISVLNSLESILQSDADARRAADDYITNTITPNRKVS